MESSREPASIPSLAWHLATLRADLLRRHGATGAGVKVGLLDTGVFSEHPCFTRSQLEAVCILPGISFAGDRNGHGTEMASLIVGEGLGIAPEAHLLSIRVGSYGAIASARVLDGLDLAVEEGCQVVSISLADQALYQPLVEAVGRATDQGIVVVAAVEERDPQRRVYPAYVQDAVAVTAHDRSYRLAAPGWPNWFDVAAPGVDVPCADLQGTTHPVSGSSPATALVAGFVAALLSLVPASDRRRVAAGFASDLRQLTDASPVGDPSCRIINTERALAAVRGRAEPTS